MNFVIVITLFLLPVLVKSREVDVPPENWQENWFEHNQILRRHYYDNDVAVYFDDDVDATITWVNRYLHYMWAYVKKTYGNFGDDPRLYVILHANKYGGCHPSSYFDQSKSYRNVVDCGLLQANAWTKVEQGNHDLLTHTTAFIVEGANKGVHGSPAFKIWGNSDSHWAEIFLYDVFRGVKRQKDAEKWKNQRVNVVSNSPRPNTYWFRDWFLPIYENFGESQVLNRFFELLARHFPKANKASFDRPEYTRDMNYGEFFHFWSGAAGVNLKNLAKKAFGWTEEYEKQFEKARHDFPGIEYSEDIDIRVKN